MWFRYTIFGALMRAGLEGIPALVLDEALKPEEAVEAMLIENLQREYELTKFLNDIFTHTPFIYIPISL